MEAKLGELDALLAEVNTRRDTLSEAIKAVRDRRSGE